MKVNVHLLISNTSFVVRILFGFDRGCVLGIGKSWDRLPIALRDAILLCRSANRERESDFRNVEGKQYMPFPCDEIRTQRRSKMVLPFDELS